MKPAQRQTAEGILFSDAYQLSMAPLYYPVGLHEKLAHCDHFFREHPSYDQNETRFCINADLDRLHSGVKRLMRPHIYHVLLTENLWQLKQELVASAR